MSSLLRVLGATVGLGALLFGVFAVLARQPAWSALSWRGAARSDPAALRRHVERLAEDFAPRDVQHPQNLERTAAYVRQAFVASGAEVRDQPYFADGVQYRNVIASFGPPTPAPLIVGAHYDAMGMFGENPGADDNASGVAGLLELARLLSGRSLSRRVELVAYSTEEPPFFASAEMGSAIHAQELAAAGVEPLGMICLEMIGYYTPRQEWPALLLRWLYSGRGDFVAVVGRWSDRALTRFVKRAMTGAASGSATPAPVYSYNGPQLEAGGYSDHRNYWARGIPAVLVTDTAFLRNPHYHQPGDRAGTLDYPRMAVVVDGVANTVLWAAAR